MTQCCPGPRWSIVLTEIYLTNANQFVQIAGPKKHSPQYHHMLMIFIQLILVFGGFAEQGEGWQKWDFGGEEMINIYSYMS